LGTGRGVGEKGNMERKEIRGDKRMKGGRNNTDFQKQVVVGRKGSRLEIENHGTTESVDRGE